VRFGTKLDAGRALVCALLLCLIIADNLHTHRVLTPAEAAPLSDSPHCLLCMAAHLPVAISEQSAIPVPSFTRETTLAAHPVCVYESCPAFTLYIRPPPIGELPQQL
jgi:hypothetical protein